MDRSRTIAPESALLWLALIFGVALIAVTPPVQTPDESHHLWRAFQLAHGDVIPELRSASDPTDGPYAHHTGGRLPAGLYGPNLFFLGDDARFSLSGLLASSRLRIDPDERFFLGFSNTAIHSPLAYLPQTVGIAVAERLTSSVVAYYYAGRVANLLAAIAIAFAAVRLAPIGKWVLVAVALTPMSLSLLASLNSDAVTLSSCLLFVALCLRVALVGATPALLGGLAVCGIAVALSKQYYLPLLALVAIVPPSRLGGFGRLAAYVACMAVAVGVLWATWGVVVLDVYSPADTTSDPQAIIEFLLAHPAVIPMRIARTLVENGLVDGREVLGNLGLLTLPLPWLLLAPHAAFLILVTRLEGRTQPRLAPWQRAVMGAVGIATALGVFVAALVGWGAPADRLVDVQGRYFLPILPLLLLPLQRSSEARSAAVRSAFPRAATAWLALLLAATSAIVASRYWQAYETPAGEHANLAHAFFWNGQVDEARRELEYALAADPLDPVAHYYLGRLADAAGDADGALAHLREVSRRPALARDFGVPGLLAWLLATRPDATVAERQEAIRLAREAVRASSPPRPDDLDGLAAALAAVGRFDEAIETARSALAATGEQRSAASRRGIKHRLERYRAGLGPEDVPWDRRAPSRSLVPRLLDPDHAP